MSLIHGNTAIVVISHPGSTWEEILNEPDWADGRPHRPGHRDLYGRGAGNTHVDESASITRERQRARDGIRKLDAKAAQGQLLNFREIINEQKGKEALHLCNPEIRPPGWRYVFTFTEEWVKNKQDWPANIKRREQQQNKEEVTNNQSEEEPHESQGDEQHPRNGGDREQHVPPDASPGGKEIDRGTNSAPQQAALLRALKQEKDHIISLRENDGKRQSTMRKEPPRSIDAADQFTPDNWVPRSGDLIRLTGKLPLNAEPPLRNLYDAGLITPNELHYVRSHGAVPQLMWEFHQLDIQHGQAKISMEELTKFATINIPILLACDNTRRKELNMIKRTKGFNWGAGGVGCAYWKGPLLHDVLIAAGVPARMPHNNGRRWWVHFEGADEPSGGNYATSIPFDYAMDPANDVILAFEMNDQPLPPDHGYPVRLMIPGWVGGRCVKWLHKVWIADTENDSYYHIWDNRIVPSFITDMDSELAELMFHHPDTACYEQVLNSVIVRPGQGEKIKLDAEQKRELYRVAGFAYGGSGHRINRVEVSLDDGRSWLYCPRTFPEFPIRHGNKFWTWVHWHVDVEISNLVRAESITVRCFNSAQDRQPREHYWNISGSMNNAWYVVKPETVHHDEDDASTTPYLSFRHPTEPGNGEGGWMKPSTQEQTPVATEDTAASQKQFTREEIEKHNRDDDCWIVVGGKVYDATSVLSWHPGGKAPIMAHAGKVHPDTTDEYASIHDDYANQKLQECLLGVATDKTIKYIDTIAKRAKESKDNEQELGDQALQRHRWVPIKLIDRKPISHDTFRYTFKLPDGKQSVGLDAGQHLELGIHMEDRMLIRPYTPTRPLLPAVDHESERPPEESGINDIDPNDDVREGKGTFDLTIKTYFPSDCQPGGAMSNILNCLPLGEEIDMRGPAGDIIYKGNGKFKIYGEEYIFRRVSLILGGSGITPGYGLLARILLTPGDATELRVIDANNTENDILMRDELDEFERNSRGQLKIMHVLNDPRDDWKGPRGFVTEDMIKRHLFEPSEESVVLLCGPPVMMEKAVLPVLDEWKYIRDKNLFGF